MDSKTTTNSSPEVLFDGMAIPPFPPLRVSVRQRFEDIRGLCTRPDDVIITTYLKSGSHWVWEIICMLLQGATAFVEQGKGSQFLEALDDLNLINKMTSPRTLNTHLPYRWLPRKHLENDGKIVHVVRNPKDVAVSMFFHFKGTGEFIGSDILDFDDRVNGMLSDATNQPYGGWFTYEKDFMKHSKANIHFVHFERLKRYPLEEIKRLADFLSVSYSDQLIVHIAEKCYFTSLKEADDTTKDTTMGRKNVHGPNPKSIFLDGTIGNWKEYFTVSQCERFDDYFCEQMQGHMSSTGGMTDGKALKEVVFDGMSLPPFKPLREGVEARLNAIKHLETRPTDILLAIYPKSGTHWVWEIVWMLLNGRAEYIKEGKESLFLEAMDDIGTIKSMDSPRVLNTNLPFRWLPQKHVESNGKIIHVIRNPKDICVSLYCHFIGSGLFMHSDGVQFADCFEGLFSKERKPPYGGWFSYEKDFEEAVSNNHNIHVLYFENLKRDPMVEIKRLAEYLQVPHSTKLLHEISDSCSFNKLKSADDTLKEKSKYKKIVVGANPKFEGDVDKVQYNSFFRKGEIGDWKNHFTVRQNERFDELYRKQMVESKLTVYFE